MKLLRLSLLAALLAGAWLAQAEIYKWVDDEGKTHFAGNKPVGPATTQTFTPSEEPAAPGIQAAKQPQEAISTLQVDLYVTSWCPYCKKAIAFLRGNNIAFNLYDIEQDAAAAERKKALDPNYEGIPLAVINGVKIRGFAEGEYRRALADKPR